MSSGPPPPNAANPNPAVAAPVSALVAPGGAVPVSAPAAAPGGSVVIPSGGPMNSVTAGVTSAGGGSVPGSSKRKEIYKYEAPWTVYSMNWSLRPDKRFRLALGSFVEEYNNRVQIVALDEETSEFKAKSTFDHPYPTTKIMWIPDAKGIYPDLGSVQQSPLRMSMCSLS